MASQNKSQATARTSAQGEDPLSSPTSNGEREKIFMESLTIRTSDEKRIVEAMVNAAKKQTTGAVFSVKVDLRKTGTLGIGVKDLADNSILAVSMLKRSNGQPGAGELAGVRLGDIVFGVNFVPTREGSKTLLQVLKRENERRRRSVHLQCWRCHQLSSDPIPGACFPRADDIIVQAHNYFRTKVFSNWERWNFIEILLTNMLEEMKLRSNIDLTSGKSESKKMLLQKIRAKQAQTLDLDRNVLQAKGLRYDLCVRIVHTKSLEDTVVYVLRIEDVETGLQWVVHRRYRDFYALHAELADMCQFTKDIPFPHKRLSLRIRYERVVEQRITGLEQYIRRVLHLLTLYASMDPSASRALRHLQTFFGVDKYINCVHPPPMDDQRFVELMAFRFLNDFTSAACQQCNTFVESIVLESFIDRDQENGHRRLLDHLSQALIEVEAFVLQNHQQQMEQALLYRNHRQTSEEIRVFIRRCVRRQVEAAIYLPLRRKVFRIIFPFLAAKSQKFQQALTLLQKAPPSYFTVDPYILKAKSFPAAIKAFRDVINAYLPADQGQLLMKAAASLVELYSECSAARTEREAKTLMMLQHKEQRRQSLHAVLATPQKQAEHPTTNRRSLSDQANADGIFESSAPMEMRMTRAQTMPVEVKQPVKLPSMEKLKLETESMLSEIEASQKSLSQVTFGITASVLVESEGPNKKQPLFPPDTPFASKVWSELTTLAEESPIPSNPQPSALRQSLSHRFVVPRFLESEEAAASTRKSSDDKRVNLMDKATFRDPVSTMFESKESLHSSRLLSDRDDREILQNTNNNSPDRLRTSSSVNGLSQNDNDEERQAEVMADLHRAEEIGELLDSETLEEGDVNAAMVDSEDDENEASQDGATDASMTVVATNGVNGAVLELKTSGGGVVETPVEDNSEESGERDDLYETGDSDDDIEFRKYRKWPKKKEKKKKPAIASDERSQEQELADRKVVESEATVLSQDGASSCETNEITDQGDRTPPGGADEQEKQAEKELTIEQCVSADLEDMMSELNQEQLVAAGRRRASGRSSPPEDNNTSASSSDPLLQQQRQHPPPSQASKALDSKIDSISSAHSGRDKSERQSHHSHHHDAESHHRRPNSNNDGESSTHRNSILSVGSDVEGIFPSCVFQETVQASTIVSADDFLPLFTYILVKADLPQLVLVKELMTTLVSVEETYGECGYYMATLEAAVHHITDLAEQFTTDCSQRQSMINSPYDEDDEGEETEDDDSEED